MEFATCQLARATLGFWYSATILFHLEVASLWFTLLNSLMSLPILMIYNHVIFEYFQGNTLKSQLFGFLIFAFDSFA